MNAPPIIEVPRIINVRFHQRHKLANIMLIRRIINTGSAKEPNEVISETMRMTKQPRLNPVPSPVRNIPQ